MQHLASRTYTLPSVQLPSTGKPTQDAPQSPDKGKLEVLGEQRRYETRPPIIPLRESSSVSSSQSSSVTPVDKLETTKSLESNPAERLFREFWEAYNTRDLAAVRRLCLPNIYMWGSGEDENLDGLDAVVKQLEDDWLKSEKASVDVVQRIPGSPNARWAAALCNATFWIKNEKGILEKHVLKNYRCTVTVDKCDTWKIAHIHGSLPDARTLDNLSTPEVRSKL